MGNTLSAQAPAPNSLPALQQTVAQRTSEWNTLAANLEQRIVRLLPCDPAARASIDEVGRASDALSVALTSFWTMASIQSKNQVEAIRGLLAQEEGRAFDWAADANQARLDVALTKAQATSLAISVRQLPAMANPQKDLESIGEEYSLLEKQMQERAGGGSRLLDDLRELLKTSQARQAAIDERMKTVSTEGQRWSAYYAAREARAQIECALVNPAAAAAPVVPRPAPQGKKQ
ncbi:MAG: hypothetical protein ABI833_02290 [Acidobacteriota bacterium]